MPEITSDNTNAPTILAEDSDDQFREWINKFKTKFTIYRVNDSYKITVEMNGENDLRLCFHIRVKNEKNPNVIDKKLLVNLKKLRAEKTYSDFKFIVGDKVFPVHKSSLYSFECIRGYV
jgi:hypothetical protein